MSHKEIMIRSLGVLLLLAIATFVVVIAIMITEAAYYFGGYWASVPTVIALAYGLIYAAYWLLDRID